MSVIIGLLATGLVLAQGVAQADSVRAEPDSVAPGYRIVEHGPVSVAAKLKPQRTTKPLTVGDRFRLELTVKRHRGQKVSEPFVEELGRFLVLDRNTVTRYQGDTIIDVHELEMAAFATGEIAVPGFLVTWPEQGEVLAVRSDSLVLNVASVMPEDMKEINDLKPQIPFPNLLPLWLTLAVLGAGGLVFLGYRWFRAWRRRRLEPEPLPESWEEALAALRALPVKEWLSRGKVKRYYYMVSEILKRYLTRRYGFPAIDQTTSEMVLAMKRARIAERDGFVGFFRRADLVKYAKLVPPMPEMETAVVQAQDLVNRTTPKRITHNAQRTKLDA